MVYNSNGVCISLLQHSPWKSPEFTLTISVAITLSVSMDFLLPPEFVNLNE